MSKNQFITLLVSLTFLCTGRLSVQAASFSQASKKASFEKAYLYGKTKSKKGKKLSKFQRKTEKSNSLEKLSKYSLFTVLGGYGAFALYGILTVGLGIHALAVVLPILGVAGLLVGGIMGLIAKRRMKRSMDGKDYKKAINRAKLSMGISIIGPPILLAIFVIWAFAMHL